MSFETLKVIVGYKFTRQEIYQIFSSQILERTKEYLEGETRFNQEETDEAMQAIDNPELLFETETFHRIWEENLELGDFICDLIDQDKITVIEKFNPYSPKSCFAIGYRIEEVDPEEPDIDLKDLDIAKNVIKSANLSILGSLSEKKVQVILISYDE